MGESRGREERQVLLPEAPIRLLGVECGQGTWGGGDTAVRMGLDPGDTRPSQALIRDHG